MVHSGKNRRRSSDQYLAKTKLIHAGKAVPVLGQRLTEETVGRGKKSRVSTNENNEMMA